EAPGVLAGAGPGAADGVLGGDAAGAAGQRARYREGAAWRAGTGRRAGARRRIGAAGIRAGTRTRRPRLPGDGLRAGWLDGAACPGRRADAGLVHRPADRRLPGPAPRHGPRQQRAVLALRRGHRAAGGGGAGAGPGAVVSDAPHEARHDPAVAAAREGVWTLAAAPAVWALHFLACYVVAAVWC